MPKILITGNGFDLNLNLPTLYSDFIKILSVLETSGDINFQNVYSQCSNYKQITENYSSFDFDLQKIDILKSMIYDNLWYNFFREEFEIETWIDFENKIEYVLLKLFLSVQNLKDEIFSKGGYHGRAIFTFEKKLFNRNIEVIEVLRRFNIISLHNNDTIVLNEEYLMLKYHYFVDVDLSKISRKLIQQLDEFKQIFNLYFEAFVVPLYSNKKEKYIENIFDSIDRHYTFNYTPTFEIFYGNKGITKFLHGRIDFDLNNIVLGVNETPKGDIDKRHFIPFTKYYQKLNNGTDYEFITEFSHNERFGYKFFFFGHSLDTSDKDYINEVFDLINSIESATRKIIVLYHNKTSKSQLIINLLNIRGKNDIEQLMRKKVLIFLNMALDKDQLKNELEESIIDLPFKFSVM